MQAAHVRNRPTVVDKATGPLHYSPLTARCLTEYGIYDLRGQSRKIEVVRAQAGMQGLR